MDFEDLCEVGETVLSFDRDDKSVVLLLAPLAVCEAEDLHHDGPMRRSPRTPGVDIATAGYAELDRGGRVALVKAPANPEAGAMLHDDGRTIRVRFAHAERVTTDAPDSGLRVHRSAVDGAIVGLIVLNPAR